MGYVADTLRRQRRSSFAGQLAIGHVRYSTAGESKLSNAQPILIDCAHGQIAIAHNGNLVNAGELRDAAGPRRIDLPDQQRHRGRAAPLRATSAATDGGRDRRVGLAGAGRVFVCADHARPFVIAVRDPHGFRPLALGRLGDAWVVCSETCALDLIGATYVRDVEPGEVLVISAEGMRSIKPFPPAPLAHCIFEHVYFARPDSYVFGRSVNEVRNEFGRVLARETGVAADVIVPIPDSGVCAAIGYAEAAGIPMRMGLIRNHYVGRTFIEPQVDPSFRRQGEAESRQEHSRRAARRPDRRLARARHDEPEDREDGARRRRARSAHAHQLPADDLAVLLRRGHAAPLRADRRHAHARGDPATCVAADSVGYLSLDGLLPCVNGSGIVLLQRLVLHRRLSGGLSARR